MYYIYIRKSSFFEARPFQSISCALQEAIQDIRSRRAIPCAMVDSNGNTVYNKKELIRAVEEYSLKNGIDVGTGFYSYLWTE